MSGFQKLAVAALVALICLIFMGAIVRATGAGMGCPDWPRCWGRLIPPTKVEEVDFSKIDLEKFKRKAARYDRDPASITVESLRASFNPVHVWTEFINRMSSLPVGLLTVSLFIASFWHRARRPVVFWAAFGALVLVIVNAWMGAKVVESGLHPGTITLHMALAMVMLCLIVLAGWRGRDVPWRHEFSAGGRGWLVGGAWVLFGLIVFEGVMGSQVRELTDQLAHSHPGELRSAWVGELEQTWIYLIHRSFSWLILAGAIMFFAGARKHLVGGAGWLETLILGLVIGQMVLGILLARVGIHPATQVLHIGLSSILVSSLFLWLLGCFSPRNR